MGGSLQNCRCLRSHASFSFVSVFIVRTFHGRESSISLQKPFLSRQAFLTCESSRIPDPLVANVGLGPGSACASEILTRKNVRFFHGRESSISLQRPFLSRQ